MPQRVLIGPAEALKPGESQVLKCSGEEVAVFNVDGAYFACSNRCPHAGGPLSEGFIDGTTVTCPWHGWAFELNCAENAPRDGVERYRVTADGSDLYLEMPD